MCTTLSGRGMFLLGASGGFAFVGHLPGIKSEALFDDVSDVTEKWDLDRVGEIRRTVAARLRSDHPPDEPSPGKGGLDWGDRVSTDACRLERGAHGAGRG